MNRLNDTYYRRQKRIDINILFIPPRGGSHNKKSFFFIFLALLFLAQEK